MDTKRTIALVAHDDKKQDLLEWARFNKALLIQHELYATGTTGKLVQEALGVALNKLQSGPLGGDQQIGAKIAASEIDVLVFFWDPLTAQPHDSDVRALLRIAMVWNVPIACNRASADFMITSPLLTSPYKGAAPDYQGYRTRLDAGLPELLPGPAVPGALPDTGKEPVAWMIRRKLPALRSTGRFGWCPPVGSPAMWARSTTNCH